MEREELENLKLEAEIAKLRAETEGARRSRLDRFADYFKIIAGTVAVVAAGYAAFETFRVTQLETKLANYEKLAALREKAEADRQRAIAIAESI